MDFGSLSIACSLGGSKLFYHTMYGVEMQKVCFNILKVVTPKASENSTIDGRKMGEKLWKVYQKFAKGIPRNSTTDFNIVISLYEMQKVCFNIRVTSLEQLSVAEFSGE